MQPPHGRPATPDPPGQREPGTQPQQSAPDRYDARSPLYPPALDAPGIGQRPGHTPRKRDAAGPAGMLDREAERTLSTVAHAAIAFGLFGFTLPVSLAISGVIWLYGKRSPYVRFHSEQAGCYQCSVLLINLLLVVMLGAAGGFSLVSYLRGESDWGAGWGFTLGLALFLVWFVGTILYGLFGALMVFLGKPFKYPLIGRRLTAGQK